MVIKEDSLASSNLVHVIGQLALVGAVRPDVIFSLLSHWNQRFTEADVVAMAGLLTVAGLSLRSADPEAMKEFVVAVHERARAVATDTTIPNDISTTVLSTRARVMLDIVIDIKNNRKRDHAMVSSKKALLENAAIGKWLKGCRVGGVAVGGIPWSKVLAAPEEKRGHWWLPQAKDVARNLASSQTQQQQQREKLQRQQGKGLGKGKEEEEVEEGRLLALAAQMHMNTDSRRAVFCAVMGSEDAVDAFEKLLRLNLQGDQSRELVRVTVECCLHESSYNPYYSQVLVRLCNVGKAHRITLQYCLWDHINEVEGEGGPVRKVAVLARLASAVIVQGAVTLAMVVKVVDFSTAAVLSSPKQVLFWRLVMQGVLGGCGGDGDVVAIFSKISAQKQLESVRIGLGAFLKRRVGPWLVDSEGKKGGGGGDDVDDKILKRCRLAERVLSSV